MNVHPFAKFYKMKVYFRMLYIVLHVLVLLQFISIVKYYYHTVGDSFLGTYLTDILIWYNYKWILEVPLDLLLLTKILMLYQVFDWCVADRHSTGTIRQSSQKYCRELIMYAADFGTWIVGEMSLKCKQVVREMIYKLFY